MSDFLLDDLRVAVNLARDLHLRTVASLRDHMRLRDIPDDRIHAAIQCWANQVRHVGTTHQ